jgi:hypothetical protein
MDTQKAFLVVGLTLVVVILFNVAILSLTKKGRSTSVQQIKMLSGLVKNARDPMKEDKEKLAELSKLVGDIQATEIEESSEEVQ